MSAESWIWLFTDKSWWCRFLLHRKCWISWPSAAAEYGEDGRRELEVMTACPCRCHGTRI